MAARRFVQPSVEEIIATIRHSDLPTVIVEGSDDVVVYRRLESLCVDIGLSILPAGGRPNVLEVFKRRGEITALKPLVFIADQDTWIFDKVPAEFDSEQMIVSEGYSIENDIFRDANLFGLLTSQEQALFKSEIAAVARQQALAVRRHLCGEFALLNVNVEKFFGSVEYRSELLSMREDERFPEELHAKINNDYARLLRGKTLLQVLLRRISHPKRLVRHNRLSLLESASVNPGPILEGLYDKISEAAGSSFRLRAR